MGNKPVLLVTRWSWIKVRTSGHSFFTEGEPGSPQLILHGKQWWLHTPVEKSFEKPAKIAEQVTTNPETRVCAIDLNLGEHIAVCTVQTVEGTIIATRFIGGGREISGFRKRQLGRIARNRRKTGIMAEGEQDNVALWRKIRAVDEHVAHLVSARIVQFAKEHNASILVFEHLGNLKPEKGKYSRRGNNKRAYWMKGRIFQYAKYKAWAERILTSRVNPRNTSRECHRCHSLIIRYNAGCPQEGYTPGAALALCEQCSMNDHADRNASLAIGQRLIARYQPDQEEKPPALRVRSQGQHRKMRVSEIPRMPETEVVGHSSLEFGHGITNGFGTAPKRKKRRMGTSSSSIPTQLRIPFE